MTKFQFDSIPDAINDLKSGRLIIVVDDENRENEGDVICAAQFATPDIINFMAVYAREVLKTHPGATVIADVKSSRVLFDEVERLGIARAIDAPVAIGSLGQWADALFEVDRVLEFAA